MGFLKYRYLDCERSLMALGRKTGGRKKGTPNKTTAALRDAILIAAENAQPGGKVGYLKWLARNNSSAFASLLGKCLPTTIAGDPDMPIRQKVDLSAYSDEDLSEMARILRRGKDRNSEHLAVEPKSN
jgi:hypothetical protein